jgi:hypothetical protein
MLLFVKQVMLYILLGISRIILNIKFKWESLTKNMGITYEKVDEIDDLYVHIYKIIDDEYKEHNVIILRNTDLVKNTDMVKLMSRMEKKNSIVHCNLIDQNDGTMIDLTSILRECIYHFEKEDVLRVNDFLKYVCYKNGIDKEILNEMFLVVYLNDDDFTEMKYKVEDIMSDLYLNDIIYGKNMK